MSSFFLAKYNRCADPVCFFRVGGGVVGVQVQSFGNVFFLFVFLWGGGGGSHHYYISQRGDGVRKVFLRKPLYQFNIAGHQMMFRWWADD